MRNLVLLAGLFTLCAAFAQPKSETKEVTFSKDVAPILFKSCVKYHRENDMAPMSFTTYKEARIWAGAIQDAVVKRRMPPWHADPAVGEFRDDPRLSDADIATLVEWAKTGAKEGNPKDQPPLPEFSSGWHLQPDVILNIPETAVSSAMHDDYQYFYIPTNFTEDRWVQAAEILPGARAVVHHAGVMVVDEARAKQHMQTRDAAQETKYRYRTGSVWHSKLDAPVVDDACAIPENSGPFADDAIGYWSVQPAIYLPGHGPEIRPPGYALKIPKGSYLEVDVHYSNHSGKDTKDQTKIGLVFVREPVHYEVQQYEMWNNFFLIPANDDNHRVTACSTLTKDVLALSYTAHMHFRGKSMRTEALFPDGRRELLFNVPHYNFRWQQIYFLKKPLLLPKGTQLIVTAYFDNSKNNPLNPDPSKILRWGEPSREEMMGFWLQAADPRDLTKPAPPSQTYLPPDHP
jgi:hypothetical protein